MKKSLFALIAVCLLAAEAAELRLSKAGQTDYVIAGDKSSMAVRELQLHLKKITGATFPICDEAKLPAGKPVIYVGETAFAKKHGLDFAKMKPDEWMYQTVGQDLIIGGHAHHGDLYAVAELLEHEFGCRWYNFNAEKIPVNPDLTLKECKRGGVPVFLSRQIVDGVGSNGYSSVKANLMFRRYDKLNKGNLDDTVYDASSKYFINCHNIYYLVPPSKYYKTHPEYYTMDNDGKRVHGNEKSRTNGSLCMSNPEVARVAAEHMIKFIGMDRERLPKGQWPLLYTIGELDATNYICYCPECSKITKKQGNFGLFLLFVNRLARQVAEQYPDVIFKIGMGQTRGNYNECWKAEKNVYYYFNPSFTRNDCFRPVTHPVNQDTKERLDGWLKTGKSLGIWDYWNMAFKKSRYFKVPRIDTMVDAIAPNYRYYAKHGLRSAFIESEYCYYWHPTCFHPLESWVGRKILEDPERDPEKLIADFMAGYFGPAVGPMTEYLNLVRKSVAEEKSKMVALNYVSRSYQNAAFFRKCYDLLHKALKCVPEKSEYAARIRSEMITPLATMLYYKKINTGLDREQLFREYAACRKEQIDLWADPKMKPALKKEVDDDVLAMKHVVEVPTPDFLKNIPETQLVKYGHDMLSYNDSHKYVKPDPDSVTGFSLGSPAPSDTFKHGLNVKSYAGMFSSSVSIYNWNTKKTGLQMIIREFPKDEKFHWYKLGNYEFLPGRVTLLMWWWHMQGDLSQVFTPPDGNNDINKYSVYVSLKFTGPSYVPGSKKQDGVFIDQIILVQGFDK